ncbi:tRNA(Ile)-lysidine synthetase [Leptospira ognonensis]|uniref:tRNA(Ile)-lysidine synthetase n=1 Tax=Leptospira ognonensis TaxID=2484945 RepID=A0A4R9K4I7_9LEPT|nr:tRNA(Ile)-lysidine synthetase [Leptospira ognonensis]
MEETGRLVRYKILEKISNQLSGYYVTGHHCFDYGESILMHLTRGAGAGSFHTLQPNKGRRFLPLVFLEDAELLKMYDFLPSLYPIFEDDSNVDIGFKRNRIRAEILPLLIKENMDFHKFYWNFHEWESFSFFDERELNEQIIKRKSEWFQIPKQNYEHLTKQQLKGILDSYLSILNFPPLYKNAFENFREQLGHGRAHLESNGYFLLREQSECIYIFRKDSAVFKSVESFWNENIFTAKWNHQIRTFESAEKDLMIRIQSPGEKMQMKYGKKEVSEIFREWKIPLLLRNHIPILYKKNLPIRILFSMFDPSLSDFPKAISESQ